MSKKIIHTTIGLYANGETKYNGVADEDLQYHIEYNKKWRFGRALIVDGKCVYEGCVDKELIEKTVAEFKANPKQFDKPTIPYH
jgi:hypothetical protein